jgi:hypothetical protein
MLKLFNGKMRKRMIRNLDSALCKAAGEVRLTV